MKAIAAFGTPASGRTFARIGWHGAADSNDRRSLMVIPSTAAGQVDPSTASNTTFDPGPGSFGLDVTLPAFGTRRLWTEDALNTVAPAGHQARVYELKDSTGAVVPHAYVVAFEEAASTAADNDYNDVVLIVRGADADNTGGGRVKLGNPYGLPFSNRMIMSRIGTLASPDPSGQHDRSVVNVKNIGTTPLTITGFGVTGPFELVTPPATPAVIAPGATQPLTVRFIAESGRVSTGKLTLTTDSATTPSTLIDLAGFWQSQPENGEEPRLDEVVRNLFGFQTTIIGIGDRINNHGKLEKIGDEVLSPYWHVADSDRPVKVVQLAAYHGVNSPASLQWIARTGAKSRAPKVVQHTAADSQTVLPRLYGGQNNATAVATFTPTASFGLGVSSEWTDEALNSHTADLNAGCTEPCGHHFRAFPAKDHEGNVIPNTYLFSMDYSGINYDYQDNIYLVSNVAPDDGDTRHVIARIDTGATGKLHRQARQRVGPGHRSLHADELGGRGHGDRCDRQRDRRPDVRELPRQQQHDRPDPAAAAVRHPDRDGDERRREAVLRGAVLHRGQPASVRRVGRGGHAPHQRGPVLGGWRQERRLVDRAHGYPDHGERPRPAPQGERQLPGDLGYRGHLQRRLLRRLVDAKSPGSQESGLPRAGGRPGLSRAWAGHRRSVVQPRPVERSAAPGPAPWACGGAARARRGRACSRRRPGAGGWCAPARRRRGCRPGRRG